MKTSYAEIYRDNKYFERIYETLRTHQDIHFHNFISSEIIKRIKGNKLDYLSIGCGDGQRTYEIIKLLRKDSYSSINVHYIDPAKWQYEKFMRNQFPEPKEVFQGTFEKYRTNLSFDVIESIHSWYGMAGDEKHILKLISLLKENGIAFVALGAKGNNLAFRIKEKYGEMRVPFIPIRFFEDFQDDVKKISHKYKVQFKVKKFELEYPPLTENGRLTSLGIILAKFYSVGYIDLTSDLTRKELIKFYHSLKKPIHVLGGMILWKK